VTRIQSPKFVENDLRKLSIGVMPLFFSKTTWTDGMSAATGIAGRGVQTVSALAAVGAGCLREEEWHDADAEFAQIILDELRRLNPRHGNSGDAGVAVDDRRAKMTDGGAANGLDFQTHETQKRTLDDSVHRPSRQARTEKGFTDKGLTEQLAAKLRATTRLRRPAGRMPSRNGMRAQVVSDRGSPVGVRR